ncbi:hypothetical protein AB0G04_09070 [Actinoplanes sp. NPDC023801]|uniref:hypothetical protein n=1 Tax=Actinoplanes sp. NPDC023801 TaxID=3154595 RepID=UPI0033F7E206
MLQSIRTSMNTDRHRLFLGLFLFVVVAHWAEHITQAVQVYALGWPAPRANGALGMAVPWLVTSEWMHYGYAVVMLAGLILLRTGFTGRARTWWTASLWIQAWHHLEHLLLLVQALTGSYLLGAAKPTSIAQLVVPRLELHLFYNAVVFLPMVVAMVLHLRPTAGERLQAACNCVRVRQPQVA